MTSFLFVRTFAISFSVIHDQQVKHSPEIRRPELCTYRDHLTENWMRNQLGVRSNRHGLLVDVCKYRRHPLLFEFNEIHEKSQLFQNKKMNDLHMT